MEIWDAYLIDGTLANIDLIRGEPIPQGLYHLVCDILVRHADGNYLLMQRDPRKPNFGGYYEATAGGSALKGESPMDCARRELQEETGIASAKWVYLHSHTAHNTIYHLYLCTTDCDKSSITLQVGETVAYRWLNEAAFIDYLHSPQVVAPQKERFLPFFAKMGLSVITNSPRVLRHGVFIMFRIFRPFPGFPAIYPTF